VDGLELLGVVAGVLSTSAFVPQAVKTVRTRSAQDFSLPMLVLLCSGVVLWLAYGALIGSVGLIVANVVTLPLALSILVVKLRHG
jgi:MtN3 and saliva related transmembrane protein